MVKNYYKILEVIVESMKKNVGNVDLNDEKIVALDLDDPMVVEESYGKKISM